MTTVATATDPDAATLLRLMWLASPALPVGGFSYSEGLESAAVSGLVHDEAGTGQWLLDQLHLGLGRAELPALADACRAWQRHDAAAARSVNDWLRQSRETAEQRAQAEQTGRSLLDWLRNGEQAGDARIAALAALPGAPLWPTAFALAAVLAGAGPREALLAFGWGWAENMAQAATKAVPLGQAAAQRVLGRLAQAMPAVVDDALALPQHRWQAFTPMLAILGAQHEAQYSRLFRS